MKTSMNKVVSFDIPIISRKEAKAKGLKRYFTGKECKNHHISERQISSGSCLKCHAEKQAKAYKENPSNQIAIVMKYRRNNRELINERERNWYHTSPVKKISLEKWQSENPEKVKQYSKKSYENNKEGYFSRAKARKYNLIEQYNKLTTQEKQEVNSIYKTRRYLNNIFGYEAFNVDHIMPLSKGGKHHPKNLTILSQSENKSKLNKFRPKDQLLWLENHFGDLPDTKSRKEKFKTLKLNVKNV